MPLSTASATLPPVLVRAAEAEVLSTDPRSVLTLLADAPTTGGAVTSNRSLFRDGMDGAPPHFHTRAGELLFVLGGRLQVLTGEEVLTLEEGDSLFVPPHTAHAFGAAAGADADVLVVFTPGLPRFDYYRLLDRVQRGEASPEEIRDSQERFDNHYVDSPAWRQARTS